MKKTLYTGLFLAMVVLLGNAHAKGIDSTTTLVIEPDHVDINAFYKGATLDIHGQCPPCDQLVVRVTGPEEKGEFKRKGRELVLWMTVAMVKIEEVPEAYLLESAVPLDDSPLLDSLGIGLQSLAGQVKIESDKPLVGNEFEDYLELKQSKGLYRIREGAVELTSGPDGRMAYRSSCFIPSSVSSGEYQVSVFAFSGGRLVGKSAQVLPIEKTGMPKYLTELAFEHPALYGIVAILVAMAAGMLMGVLFNRKNKGGVH